jgi:hypothetical protein
MIPISEKSSGGAFVDWVPEGHHRQIHRTCIDVDADRRDSESAPLALMREARSGFAGTGFATATMLLLVPWRSYPTDRGGGRRDARVIQFTAPRWGCGWAASRRLRNTGNLEEHPRRRLWRHLAWAKKLERRRDPGAGR